VLDEQHFVDLARRQFLSQRRDTFADDHGRKTALRLRCNLLRSRQRFEAGLVPQCIALFGDQENIHWDRASL